MTQRSQTSFVSSYTLIAFKGIMRKKYIATLELKNQGFKS